MSDRIAVMRAGHILQVGSPREIYTEPANRFVASFIGETNFLKGTMVDDTQVALPGGEVLAVAVGAQAAGTQAAGMHAGQHVDLAIRPEQIRILPANSPDTIAGIVSGSVYFGTDTHCNITLNGTEGAQIVVRLQSPVSGSAGLDVGASVGVAFNPGALRVIGA
jgi:spermidine/putrescine transport system ATP-binding protein